ncbi:olfactory receptor 14I1-like [Tachyglossus aculeatus]|uniref:olfactory receptor 14I1-like n=1 Tax=Tachyglossus aculeatus TaxID=9261 RepID=UPI0018F3B71C|nr:olfactory receptor 14I1-like [Tachyglossus aculeatus]
MLVSNDYEQSTLIHTALFLPVYLAAVMGNILIIAITTLDRHLHIPMYFFLKNLSILDLGYISVTVPKSTFNSLTNINSISLLGWAAQVFFVFLFGGSELALLTVMSHDRYVAICRPLHYEIIIPHGACVNGKPLQVPEEWVFFVFLYGGSELALLTVMSHDRSDAICHPLNYEITMPHGACLLRIAYSTYHVSEDVSFAISICLGFFCFVFIVGSFNLSVVDVACISVTVPKSILNSLTKVNSISLMGCATQVFCDGAQLLRLALSTDHVTEDVCLAINI